MSQMYLPQEPFGPTNAFCGAAGVHGGGLKDSSVLLDSTVLCPVLWTKATAYDNDRGKKKHRTKNNCGFSVAKVCEVSAAHIFPMMFLFHLIPEFYACKLNVLFPFGTQCSTCLLWFLKSIPIGSPEQYQAMAMVGATHGGTANSANPM